MESTDSYSHPPPGSRKRSREDDHYGYGGRPHTTPIALAINGLKRDFGKLCDPRTSQNPLDDLKFVAGRILDMNITSEKALDELADIFLAAIRDMPIKIPHIAGLVQLIFASNRETATHIVDTVSLNAQSLFSELRPTHLKLYIRFLICCWPLVPTESALNYMQKFLKLCDLTTSGLIKRDIIYSVLINTFYFPKNGGNTEELKTLIKEATDIFQSLSLNPLSVWIGSAPYPSTDITTCLVQQLLVGEQNFYPACIQRFDSLCELCSKQKASITVKEPLLPNTIKLAYVPESSYEILRFYYDQSVETTPKTEDANFSIFHDVVVDTINALEYNRSTSIQLVMDMDVYFAPDIFALRGTPLKALENSGSKWKIEDIVTETIFSEMLRVPKCRFPQTYYHSLLIEACVHYPKIMASSIGRAIRNTFNNAEKIRQETQVRFIDWFSQHLSNFSYTWKWGEWSEWSTVEKYSLSHPRLAFVKFVIDKELRLSFVKRISESLPQEFRHFLGREPKDFQSVYAKDRKEGFDKLSHQLRSDDSEDLKLSLEKFDFLKDDIDKCKFTFCCLAHIGRDILGNSITSINKHALFLKALVDSTVNTTNTRSTRNDESMEIEIESAPNQLSAKSQPESAENAVIHCFTEQFESGFIQAFLNLAKLLEKDIISGRGLIAWYFDNAPESWCIGDTFLRFVGMYMETEKAKRERIQQEAQDCDDADKREILNSGIEVIDSRIKEFFDYIWSKKAVSGISEQYRDYWLVEIRYQAIMVYFGALNRTLSKNEVEQYLQDDQAEFVRPDSSTVSELIDGPTEEKNEDIKGSGAPIVVEELSEDQMEIRG